MMDICVVSHLSGEHYLEETVHTYLSLKDNTTRMKHKSQITMNRTTQITMNRTTQITMNRTTKITMNRTT
jgi:hypothetical protein